MTENQLYKLCSLHQTSETPPKGEKMDAITNGSSKKNKPETIHPKPQADQIMNLDLNSENDI